MVWSPNPGSPLLSGLSRVVVVSAASVVFTVSADIDIYRSLVLRMCNVWDQDLDTIAYLPAVLIIFVTFEICHETQLTNTNSKECKTMLVE